MTDENSSREIELTPQEEGIFVNLVFDGEQESTVIFVADQDFEQLQEMAENPEKNWEDFRNEFLELVEHTGHDQDHELGEATTLRLQEKISNYELD